MRYWISVQSGLTLVHLNASSLVGPGRISVRVMLLSGGKGSAEIQHNRMIASNQALPPARNLKFRAGGRAWFEANRMILNLVLFPHGTMINYYSNTCM